MGACAAQEWNAMSAISRQPSRPPTAGSSYNGTTKRVWMLLYKEGGRWTSEEIRTHPDIRLPLATTLADMVRYGCLERFRSRNIDGELTVTFAVTKKCRVARGVTIDEMWQVLQGKP